MLWEGFEQYLNACAPTDWHRAEVRRYRERIFNAMSGAFNVVGMFQSGSFQHGTGVMPWSDVDYMVRIMFTDRPASSTTVLNKMYDVLKQEFAGETWDIHVDRPSVTLRFNALITDYEVTPAYLLRGSEDDDIVFNIPASAGGWREAAPKAHNKFVSRMDTKHNGGVRELARLLKAWKYEKWVPISSFYLEMRAAEYGKNHDSIWTLEALREVVNNAINSNLAAMNDPAGLVSRVSPCSSEGDRTRSLTHLRGLKKNLDDVRTIYFADQPDRYRMNQALQAIWGDTFPYCDPYAMQD